MRNIINHLKCVWLFCLLIAVNHAQAAPPVDAGSIQRDIERLNKPNLPPATQPKDTEKIDSSVSNNVAIKVSAFQFVGASLLPDALLQAEVASYIGQTLDYNALNKVTKKISELYRAKGWLAKVYLPPQDIQNGLVTIEINEAKLGEVRTSSDAAARLKPAVANHILANVQQKGAPLSSQALERAMLLINDRPGFAAQATLSSGAQTGETDVTLSLTDEPIFGAKVWADNYGSRLLGKLRVNGALSFDNLTGYGDRLQASATKSRGLEYVHGIYEFPVGYSGTVLNIGGSVTNYEVVGDGFSDLEAEGESYSYKLGMRHAIVRGRTSNLTFDTGFESIRGIDNVLGFEVSDKQYRTLTFALGGDHSDNFGLGGVFWGGVRLTTGNLELNNQDDLAANNLTSRIDGHYNKVNVHLGRKQAISEKLSAQALFSAQLADKNLGSFEKFSLGGPSGLGGFTAGEAAADQGWMLNLEGRYIIAPHFSASILADAGGVCQFKNTWAGWDAGNPKLQNCYQLASTGFALGFSNKSFAARLAYNRQITGNRGLDANGNDSEGESSKHQLWLTVEAGF